MKQLYCTFKKSATRVEAQSPDPSRAFIDLSNQHPHGITSKDYKRVDISTADVFGDVILKYPQLLNSATYTIIVGQSKVSAELKQQLGVPTHLPADVSQETSKKNSNKDVKQTSGPSGYEIVSQHLDTLKDIVDAGKEGSFILPDIPATFSFKKGTITITLENNESMKIAGPAIILDLANHFSPRKVTIDISASSPKGVEDSPIRPRKKLSECISDLDNPNVTIEVGSPEHLKSFVAQTLKSFFSPFCKYTANGKSIRTVPLEGDLSGLKVKILSRAHRDYTAIVQHPTDLTDKKGEFLAQQEIKLVQFKNHVSPQEAAWLRKYISMTPVMEPVDLQRRASQYDSTIDGPLNTSPKSKPTTLETKTTASLITPLNAENGHMNCPAFESELSTTEKKAKIILNNPSNITPDDLIKAIDTLTGRVVTLELPSETCLVDVMKGQTPDIFLSGNCKFTVDNKTVDKKSLRKIRLNGEFDGLELKVASRKDKHYIATVTSGTTLTPEMASLLAHKNIKQIFFEDTVSRRDALLLRLQAPGKSVMERVDLHNRAGNLVWQDGKAVPVMSMMGILNSAIEYITT